MGFFSSQKSKERNFCRLQSHYIQYHGNHHRILGCAGSKNCRSGENIHVWCQKGLTPTPLKSNVEPKHWWFGISWSGWFVRFYVSLWGCEAFCICSPGFLGVAIPKGYRPSANRPGIPRASIWIGWFVNSNFSTNLSFHFLLKGKNPFQSPNRHQPWLTGICMEWPQALEINSWFFPNYLSQNPQEKGAQSCKPF